MIKIEISSKSEVIGTVSADQFKKSVNAPAQMFLSEVVAKWNDWKVSIGEPERAAIKIK